MRVRLFRILAALSLLVAGLLLPQGRGLGLLLLLLAYAISGYDVLWRAISNIIRGQVFDENFLMALATVGALVIGEYAEAVAVMVFYQVGELFQDHAVDRSRRAITGAMHLRPDLANLLLADGSTRQVHPEDLQVGQSILIRPGERIPVDGRVLLGASQLDTAALTGEALPREVGPGDGVLSGCVNISGALTLQVEKAFAQSTVSRILEMVEDATDRKSRQEAFITRFSAVYTPVVVILALLLAFLPPLLLPGALLADWVYRALNFLVVSCPCALVISIPLSFFGGIGGASRAGILTKGGNYLEALAKVDTFVFDKTGTLTEGSFSLAAVHTQGISREQLLDIAAQAEQQASHPLASAILKAYEGHLDPQRVSGMQEQAGGGLSALVDGRQVLLGNQRLLQASGILLPENLPTGTLVHAALDGSYVGSLVFEDRLKPSAREALQRLRRQGARQLVMLTGDSQQAAQAVARELGLSSVHSGLLPQDKVRLVEELLNEPGRRGRLAFVGDGVNDAPVLARADVGIAMGGLGSDAAIEAADIVIMNDDPGKIATALSISRRTVGIATQNAVFAISVKVLVLILAALGLSTLWMAVFADVGVSVIAVLNAMRALKLPREGAGLPKP